MRKKCKNCQNKAAKDRSICYNCFRKRTKQTNPYLYFFDNLRGNARRRGIAFHLTLDQFKNFAFETDYIKRKGQSTKSLTIDRIDSNIGYHIDNIQVLTNRANVIKQRLYYFLEHRRFRVRKVSDWSNAPPTLPDSDCPF